MKSKYDNIKQQTRLLVDEALNTVKAGFSNDDRHLRPLEFTQLEQRVLMSASPLAMAVEAVDPTAAEPDSAGLAAVEVNRLDSSVATDGSDNSQTPAIQASVELVVIDPSADNHAQLVADLQSNSDRIFEILVLEPTKDGISQITDSLMELRDVSAIHLVSHGDDGEILLGSSVLSQRSIQNYAAELVSWQYSMTVDADLLVYGCDLTASADGVALTESLSTLLALDVAASSDATGHADLGGDWQLEHQLGVIETEIAFSSRLQLEWEGLLAVGDFVPTDEFSVATTTSGAQTTNAETRGSQDAVAIDANGNYVVVWSSNQAAGADGDGFGVLARLFNANGEPSTSEIQVNTTTLGDQQSARVVRADDGTFVVTWTSGVPGSEDVYFQRFAANGTKLGSETLANNTTSNSQKNSVIAMDKSTGEFVISWQGEGPGDTAAIFFRQFNADGTVKDGASSPDRIATLAGAVNEVDPAIAMQQSGKFVIAWGRSTGAGIWIQQFDADGNKQGDVLLADSGLFSVSGVDIDTDDAGNFTVVLRQEVGFSGGWSRGFNADGIQRFGWRQFDAGDIASASVSMLPDGGHIVTWQKTAASDVELYGQRFNAQGDATGSVFRLNETSTGIQRSSSIATINGDKFVVAWSGEGEGDTTGVYAKQFHALAPLVDLDADNSSGAMGSNFHASYLSGDSPVSIVDGDATLTDPTSANLQSMTVTITDRQNGINEILAASTSGTNISASFDTNSGQLTLSGDDTVANYQAVLRSITYQNVRNVAFGPSRTITIVANDGTNSSNLATAHVSIYNAVSTQLAPTADAYISDYGLERDDNHGASNTLVVDKSGSGIGNQRALLQFGLGSIPAGATINNASLKLNAVAVVDPMNIDVYEVTEAWDEGVGSGTADSVNWNDRKDGIAWSDDGGAFAPSAIDTVNAAATGIHSWNITSLVQSWLDGVTDNNGVILGSTDSGSEAVVYDSREGGTAPQLVVSYAIPAGSNSAPTVSLANTISLPENTDTVSSVKVADIVVIDDASGTNILALSGTDSADFVIVNGNELHLASGTSLDFELKPTYDVTVTVDDPATGSVVDDSAAFTLNLLNVNDTAPVINSGQSFSIAAGSVADDAILGTVGVSDADNGTTYSNWTITGGNASGAFQIESTSGVISVANSSQLNSSVSETHTLSLMVSDGTNTSAVENVQLHVVNSTIVVDTTADTSDGDVSSIAALYANKGADGAISLREAVHAANNTANSGGLDRIQFEIASAMVSGAHTIELLSMLPAIESPLIVDGTTDGDFTTSPIIILDGSSAGVDAVGLNLAAGSNGSIIRGLAINQFAGSGIYVAASGNHSIVGNFIGTDNGGATDLGNEGNGIFIVSSTGNTIGGATAADRNVIIGNDGDGIRLSSANDNVIYGNYIGLSADGLQSVGQDQSGIQLMGSSASNIIGGSASGQGNVIVGSDRSGIQAGSTTFSNVIMGNRIGVSPGGASFGNGEFGIKLQTNASSYTIGGANSGEGNLIANNGSSGIAMEGAASNVAANHQLTGNLIYANGGLGIDSGSDGVSLQSYTPTLTLARTVGNNLDVVGNLSGTAGSTYQVAFYASATADGSGHGEAERFLGVRNVVIPTGSSAVVTFNETLTDANVSAGEFVTATAYTTNESTSEFSMNVIAAAAPLNNAPTARIASMAAISEGSGTVLDGTGSTDPDSDSLTYEWDLAYDGTTFSADFTSATVSLDWSQLYAAGIDDDGSYQIALRVNDGTVDSAIQTSTLIVQNSAPDISVTGSTDVGSGETYSLNLVHGDFGNDSVQNWTVNWGDGSIETFSGTQTTVTHVFTNGGFTNNITFSVTDEDGSYTPSTFVVTSYSKDRVHFTTNGVSTAATVYDGPASALIGPDGLLYVSNLFTNDIDRLDSVTGSYVDSFVYAGSGGLDAPGHLAFGPDGSLFVSSRGTGEVLRYGTDGRFLGALVSGLDHPGGITFDNDGNLFVAEMSTGDIWKIDSQTGVQIGALPFASFGVSTFIELNFGPGGNLFASSSVLDVIREFDSAGTVVGDFGGGVLSDVQVVRGFHWGPDGHLYVTDSGGEKVVEYTADGTLVGTYATVVDPLDLTFSPALQVTVNENPVGVDDAYAVVEGGSLNVSTIDNWAFTSSKYRQQVFLDNTGNSDALIDAPVMIRLHATATDALNIDYAKTRDGGADLRFVDPDGTVLDYEIESWDATGYSSVWVRVPAIDAATAADHIWMYYGNDEAAFGDSVNGVWADGYKSVLHLNSTGHDATGNDNAGLVSDLAATQGVSGAAAVFNGTTSRVTMGSADSLDNIFVGGGSVSAWVNPASSGEGGYGRILDKASTVLGSTVGVGWTIEVTEVGSANGGQLIFEYAFSDSQALWRTQPGSISASTWQNVSIVYDSSSDANVPKIYIDGILQTLTVVRAPSGTALSDADLPLLVGDHGAGANRSFHGLIDEVRVADVPLSGGQIAADVAGVLGTLASAPAGEQTGPGGLLNNDTDAEGNNLTVSLVSGPAHAASFTLNTDGSFDYIHDGAETTTDSFSYSISDGTTTSAPVTVNLAVSPVNDAPVISSIGDVQAEEDSTVGPISFTVGDADSDVSDLVVISSSSNHSLIADGSIVVSGSGVDRTVKFTPVANASGTATITLGVTDGTATSTTTFEVTITPVNDAPTISAISDVSTPEDTATGVLTFTVADVDSPPSEMSITATSGDPSVVADAGIELGGTGANRTIRVTPVANANGIATITVTVSDGVNSVDRTFDVTVTAVNDAPTIAVIPDATTPEDTPIGPYTFEIGDVDNDADLLTVEAVSSNQGVVTDADIVIGGSGANRTITVSPVENSFGVTTITVTLFDGELTTTETFNLAVTAVNDAPVISEIPDVSAVEDTPIDSYAFNVSDVESDSEILTVTASSSDQDILPDNRISITGSGVNRTISVSPTANAFGEVDVTLTVSDGETTGQRTFKLTIDPVNDAPVVSAIANMSIFEDTPVGPVAFTVRDVDNLNRSLVVSVASSNPALIADSDISIGGSHKNRTLSFQPVTDAFGGPVTIVVSVSDGETTVNSSFQVDVKPVNDAPVSDSSDQLEFVVEDVAGLQSDVQRLLEGATDAEGDPIAVVLAAGPSHGVLDLKADGTFSYVAEVGFFGTDSFEFFLTDGMANGSTSVVYLQIPSVVLPPPGVTIEPPTEETQIEPDEEKSVQEVLVVTSGLKSGNDEDSDSDTEQGFAAKPATKGDDDTVAERAFHLIQTDEATDALVFVDAITIGTAEADSVQASELAHSLAQSRRGINFSQLEQQREANSLMVFTAVSYEDFADVKNAVDQVNQLRENLDTRIDMSRVAVGTVATAGVTVFVSTVFTAVRTGVLALGFITQLPVWTMFDPLMFMDGASGEEGDSLEEIVDRNEQATKDQAEKKEQLK